MSNYCFILCGLWEILALTQVCSCDMHLGIALLTKYNNVDENRQIVVEGSYTLPIIRHFLNPELVHVAIPVIYNICMDYGEKNPPVSKTMAITDEDIEPAHAQMAENRTAYIILKLLKDGAIKDNGALLSFSYDLVELASEQGKT
jgi:hypothetical protein